MSTEMYRKKLLTAGFQQATSYPERFYRVDTELTAFFVNLKILPDCVGVFYGIGSTAFTRMAGSEDALVEDGIWEEYNCMRFYGEICTEADEAPLAADVAACFRQYHGLEKDDLLKLLRDRRRVFLETVTTALKPLGFRKKGNQWRKPLAEKVVLEFHADKNPYGDAYFFDINIYCTASSRGLYCYTTRMRDVNPNKERDIERNEFDWQLQPREELMAVMDRALQEHILPMMSMPISELGEQKYIWDGCICPRDCCEICWIRKNYWEANGIKRDW